MMASNKHRQAELDDATVDTFWRDGYIVLRGWYSGDDIDALRHALQRDIDHPQSNVVLNLTGRSDLFFDIVRSSRLVWPVAQLIGPNIAFHHSKWHRGSPNSEWHRDICSHPQTNTALVAVSIYLDDVSLTHGALAVVPGSHKLATSERLVLGSVLRNPSHADRQLTLEMAAGDVCIHHGCLVHRPSPCEGERPRNVVLISYRASDAQMLVPNTFGEAASGEIVTGVEPTTWRIESTATVYAPECVGDKGDLRKPARAAGLRIRGQKFGMM